jgi:hypothetical protein
VATASGERMLDGLMALGYAISMADDGEFAATKATQTTRGTAQHGAIER